VGAAAGRRTALMMCTTLLDDVGGDDLRVVDGAPLALALTARVLPSTVLTDSPFLDVSCALFSAT
jgi:hypothetical protein